MSPGLSIAARSFARLLERGGSSKSRVAYVELASCTAFSRV